MTIRPTEESWKLLDNILNDKKTVTGKTELFLILILFFLVMALFFLFDFGLSFF